MANTETLAGIAAFAYVMYRMSRLRVVAKPADWNRTASEFIIRKDHPNSLGTTHKVIASEVGPYGIKRDYVQTPIGRIFEYHSDGGSRSDMVSTRVF